MVDLAVKLDKLELKSPIMNASGTYGYGSEYAEHVPVGSLGAFVTKTVTKEPKQGNVPPRIWETACGMLNSIGLENIGVEKLVADHLPHLKSCEAKVIVSVGGGSVEEYSEVVQMLTDEEGVDGFELNLSCPNVKEGGLHFGRIPEIAHRVVSTVRKATPLFLSAKLSPNSDVPEVARACAEAGCESVTLINALPGMAVSIREKKPRLGGVTGGLSGPAIKPVAIYWVHRVAREVKIPIIGVGGIMTSEDALEFIIAGASAIQVGTANFVDPTTPLKILSGIQNYCESEKIGKLSSLTGCLYLQELPDGDQAAE